MWPCIISFFGGVLLAWLCRLPPPPPPSGALLQWDPDKVTCPAAKGITMLAEFANSGKHYLDVQSFPE